MLSPVVTLARSHHPAPSLRLIWKAATVQVGSASQLDQCKHRLQLMAKATQRTIAISALVTAGLKTYVKTM